MPWAIGDVLGILSLLLGVIASGWTLLVIVALLFGKRAQLAKSAIETRPWQTLGIGVVVSLVAGLVGAGLSGSGNGIAKLVGWVLLSSLLAGAFVGASGLTLMVGSRIRSMAPDTSEFASLSKAAGVVVVAGLVPFAGWFMFAIGTLVSVGAGAQAILARENRATLGAPAGTRAIQ